MRSSVAARRVQRRTSVLNSKRAPRRLRLVLQQHGELAAVADLVVGQVDGAERRRCRG
jgi:hypothetical protein